MPVDPVFDIEQLRARMAEFGLAELLRGLVTITLRGRDAAQLRLRVQRAGRDWLGGVTDGARELFVPLRAVAAVRCVEPVDVHSACEAPGVLGPPLRILLADLARRRTLVRVVTTDTVCGRIQALGRDVLVIESEVAEGATGDTGTQWWVPLDAIASIEIAREGQVFSDSGEHPTR